MVTSSPDFKTQSAARVLFGPEVLEDEAFWKNLDQATLKMAFKKRALETHPDRAKILGTGELLLRSRFQRISAAYEQLSWAIQNEPQTIQVSPISKSALETEQTVDIRPPLKSKTRSRSSAILALFAVLMSFSFSMELNFREPAVTTATEIKAPPKEPTPEPQNAHEVLSTQIELTDNLFRPGRYKAAKHIRAELIRAIETAKGEIGHFNEKTTITVIGHADGAPIQRLKAQSQIHNNEDLALVRAQHAAQALEKLGIPAPSLRAEGGTLRNTRSLTIRVDITVPLADSWKIKLSRSLSNLKGLSIQTKKENEALIIHFADNTFIRGRSTLSPEMSGLLQKVATAVQQVNHPLSVIVLGYSGKATPFRNQKLALTRAQAAFLVLEEAGIPTQELRAFYSLERDTRSISIELRPLPQTPEL